MTLEMVMKELESFGNDSTKRIFLNHGAKEPLFGVKVQDLKKIVKKVKKDHDLALQLFDTGNSDAKYLAGLIADENRMTKSDLKKWAKNAGWYMIAEYSVPWVTAESPHAEELANEWIQSKNEIEASAGWATWANIVGYKEDSELDLNHLNALISKVENEIHASKNRVRYSMNNFIIAVGSFVIDLNKRAVQAAKKIGKVEVNMGDTACKVPLATSYIQKVIERGKLGKKRKTTRC